MSAKRWAALLVGVAVLVLILMLASRGGEVVYFPSIGPSITPAASP
jgi:hypothetical protein